MREKLIAIQRREGLTDAQMATRIGCARPTWNLIKNGRKPLHDTIAMRAAGAFPELTRDLLDLAAAVRVSVASVPANARADRPAA
jgi:DNA-binding XRE family transcriptional regulator